MPSFYNLFLQTQVSGRSNLPRNARLVNLRRRRQSRWCLAEGVYHSHWQQVGTFHLQRTKPGKIGVWHVTLLPRKLHIYPPGIVMPVWNKCFPFENGPLFRWHGKFLGGEKKCGLCKNGTSKKRFKKIQQKPWMLVNLPVLTPTLPVYPVTVWFRLVSRSKIRDDVQPGYNRYSLKAICCDQRISAKLPKICNASSCNKIWKNRVVLIVNYPLVN